MTQEQRVEIPGADLRLEGRLQAGPGALAALVLHPHPKYGGDMDNHVVLALCDALRALDATTLGFDFRGAGQSEGQFHGHGGEWTTRARRWHVCARPLLAGASSSRALFGASIAASLAGDEDVAGLVLISLPVGMMGTPAIGPDVKTLLVTGDRDHIAPPEALEPLAFDGRELGGPGRTSRLVAGCRRASRRRPHVRPITDFLTSGTDRLEPAQRSARRCHELVCGHAVIPQTPLQLRRLRRGSH